MLKNTSIHKALLYVSLLCISCTGVKSQGRRRKGSSTIHRSPRHKGGIKKHKASRYHKRIGRNQGSQRIASIANRGDDSQAKRGRHKNRKKQWVMMLLLPLLMGCIAILTLQRAHSDEGQGSGGGPQPKPLTPTPPEEEPHTNILEPIDPEDERERFIDGYGRVPYYGTTEEIVRRAKTQWNAYDIDSRQAFYQEAFNYGSDIFYDADLENSSISQPWSQLCTEVKTALAGRMAAIVLTEQTGKAKEEEKERKQNEAKKQKKSAFTTLEQAMNQFSSFQKDGIYPQGIRTDFTPDPSPSYTCPLCTFDVPRNTCIYCPMRPSKNHYLGCIACVGNMLPQSAKGRKGLVYECSVHHKESNDAIKNVVAASNKLVNDAGGRAVLKKKGIEITQDTSGGFYIDEYSNV